LRGYFEKRYEKLGYSKIVTWRIINARVRVENA
jgi:hypothetical protein